MGRKSTKGKERKTKRKELQQISQHLWSLVEEASKVEDPLEALVSFKKFTRCDLNLTITCEWSALMEKNTLQWAFDLTKANMELLYDESGWGWKESEKMREMKDERARYLIARDEFGKPVAFVNFRFDIDYEQPVVYCYEIQIENDFQRKGLGVFLMQILQLLAIKNNMFKVVATVLKDNTQSVGFFTKKLKFTEDSTSPDDECYIIVSKMVKINLEK